MTTTSREYAEALFELAAEEKLVPETSEGLELVRAAVREEPGYLALLASPAIGKDARLSALDGAVRGRIPEILLGVLRMMISRGHAQPRDTEFRGDERPGRADGRRHRHKCE